jgi:hypothetical protein
LLGDLLHTTQPFPGNLPYKKIGTLIKYLVLEIENQKVIECDPSVRQLANEQDGLDLVGVLFLSTGRICSYFMSKNLVRIIFDLKTGNAGSILNKS